MNTDELRQKYLDFFVSKDHRLCPSDVLVPRWDKSVLFTPAGMNQFKDHFLGKVELEFTRATSCQKCLRTGDIENVGRTAYHHTFFEMLGNFSFGDYFKREAIHWAWEFLTDKKWLNIDPARLSVTVYKDDDEAARIWADDIGVADRISREDEDENFWPASAPSQGPDGVCGPCSEIYYTPDDGNPVEVWNLVFTQFNRVGDPPDNLHPLPSKNIDTGMGLERIAATLQGVTTNYHIDTIRPIVEAAAEVCRTQYDPDSETGRRLRRITDHIRACTFCIHENVYPGAKKDEYVVKRLLRRAVLDGHQMGLREPFLNQLVPAVAEQMSNPYPELKETIDRVAKVIKKEENNFFESIDDGIARVETLLTEIEQGGSQKIDGEVAAELYTTYGVPPELVDTIGQNRGLDFDWPGFEAAMDLHGRRSGTIADTVMGDFGPLDEIKKEVKSTGFVGYETTEADSEIVALVDAQTRTNKIDHLPDRDELEFHEHLILLRESPFYAESGGQVGDTGTITTESGRFQVNDTQKNGDVIVHYGEVVEGTISVGDKATASVDPQRRAGIRRAHSATHILHHALQTNLGAHAQQRGSKVDDDWLRFDFSNLEPVGIELVNKIESDSNDRVSEASLIKAEILPLAEARNQGAMMLFGEKYPDPVRMVSMGDFSKELCGGTHLTNTSDVEAFEVVSEEGVAAGTRRIVALTGDKANEQQQKTEQAIEQIANIFDVQANQVADAVEQLAKKVREFRKLVSSGTKKELSDEDFRIDVAEISDGAGDYWRRRSLLRKAATTINAPPLEVPDRVKSMLEEIDSLKNQLEKIASAETVDANSLIGSATIAGDTKVIAAEIPGGNPNLMRGLIDQIRKQISPAAIFLAASPGDGKVLLVAGISQELVDRGLSAGNWVKEVAPVVGGGGGGRPDMAQAGGKQPENIGKALEAASDFLRDQIAAKN